MGQQIDIAAYRDGDHKKRSAIYESWSADFSCIFIITPNSKRDVRVHQWSVNTAEM